MNKEDLIIGYFENSLNNEEMVQFENLYNTNDQFREQVDFERDVQKVAKDLGQTKLRNELKLIEDEIQKDEIINDTKANERKTVSLFNYRNFAIAASLAILMGILGYNFFFSTNPEKIYNNYYQIYPNTEVEITRGQDEITELQKAFVAYEKGDFAFAINLLENLTKDEKFLDLNLDFYLAQSYLANQDFAAAESHFESLSKTNSEYQAESLWYLALIQIKNNNYDTAKINLKKLIEIGTYKKHEAEKLLQKLS